MIRLRTADSSRQRPLVEAARWVWQLRRPILAWSVLVWSAALLVLSPLSALAIGRLLGPEGVISNEEVVAWLVTPAGFTSVLLTLTSVLAVSVAMYGGLFRLVDDHRARIASLPRAALALTTELPSVVRFCGTLALAILALVAPLAGFVLFVVTGVLGEHDINYYVSARPPEWYRALALTLPVVVAWTIVAAWLACRTLPALPAFFDGHRPTRAALAAGWRVSRGRSGVLAARLTAAAALALVAQASLGGVSYSIASTVVERVAHASSSLRPVLVATAASAAIISTLEILVSIAAMAWLSTILTRFYLDTRFARRQADPSPAAFAPHGWLTGRRAGLLTVAGVAVSTVIGIAALESTSQPPRFLVIAHRAGARHAPENTLLALERAIAARTDFAEIDVQRTRDGVVVVAHDADLMRVARDPRTIAGTDYAGLLDVRQGPDDGSPPEERRLARLSEFLDRARGRIGLAVELKYYGWDPRLAAQVVAEIRAARLERQVMILSLSLRAIDQVRQLAPEMATGYLSAVSVGRLDRLPVSALALARPRSPSSVIRDAHARGLKVFVWTVNDAAGIIEMIGRGADGIITDDAILAVRIRDELQSLTSTELLILRFSDAFTGEETGGGPPRP